MFFLSGLIVGDLDSKLQYRKWADRGIPLPFPSLRDRDRNMRLHGRWLAWLLFLASCAQQWITYIALAPGSNLNNIEQNIHPDWQTSKPLVWEESTGYQGYASPLVFGFFLFSIVDLSPGFQKFFQFRFWQWLGVHSMSIYLLHGIVWWTWAAWLSLTMLTHGVPYWATVLICLLTGYPLLFVMAVLFTYTFEHWATLLSKAIWRAASGQLGRKV